MDDGGYERIVMEHKDRILSYATMMLRDSSEAQDIAQESLVRLWQHRAGVDGDGAVHWLRRTAHNLCIDRLRRRRSRPETCDEDAVARGVDPAAGPDRRAESGQMVGMLQRALAALPERDRAVILLREVQGLPYGEIAEILDVPLGTLKARLHRAREQLRARLTRSGVAP
jgi:RNA polymerase sigma-70 factor (ECF subfamily)